MVECRRRVSPAVQSVLDLRQGARAAWSGRDPAAQIASATRALQRAANGADRDRVAELCLAAAEILDLLERISE